MGEFSVTKWKCDRCGCVHDKRPQPHYQQHTVKAYAHQEWAGGEIINWKEMCADCDKEVADGLSELRKVKHTKEPRP